MISEKKIILLFAALLFTVNHASAQSSSNLKLWYDKPASNWNEALPVGNGRLGAMIFGIPSREKIQLNEETVWAGSPYKNYNPKAKVSLSEIRKLIFEGKYEEAENLADTDFLSPTAHGMPYQTVGDLIIDFPEAEKYTDYYRELNIDSAVAVTTYKSDGVRYKREIFSSFTDNVIIVRLTSDQKNKINFTASFESSHAVKSIEAGENKIILSGRTSDHEGIPGKIKFTAHVLVSTDGGQIMESGNSLTVQNADTATLYISIATNFVNYNNISADEQNRAEDFLGNAVKIKYADAVSSHVKYYRNYFRRVSFDLGTSSQAAMPTDRRIREFSRSDDPQLVALYFQFGRYLLISSSQPGGQPSNLQGIWNDHLNPPWDSKYTVNINTEMNYWPSETINLTEMNEPLISMIKELSDAGSETAKKMYGVRGWVLHHNTDIWRMSGPVDKAFYGMWPMGGAWLTQHLWEKFLFSGDLKYLESVYPVMKSASEFFLDFLVEEPVHRWLVVAPSMSPENSPSVHKKYSIAAGATMDNQLVFDLFTKTIAASELLGTDKNFTGQMKSAMEKLPPMQIGRYGQLQEWLEDWDNPEDKHRHVSHLYGLFPGNQISPYRTPELADAARTSLIQRGDESTGWSMGWKVNLWARLLDGNHALKLITDQLKIVVGKDDPDFREGGGTYPNLFDAHPPFQIDGNFGCTSGITEMLMQSHDGFIYILPALPDRWKDGNISGLRARGDFEISIKWADNKIDTVRIKSNLGGNCRIGSKVELIGCEENELTRAHGGNPNPFYKIPEIKKPLISAAAVMKKPEPGNIFIYDLQTLPGEEYVLTRSNQ